MIENLNGRVRKHLYYRQESGRGFLDLLRFYFNHTHFLRSTRVERHKKSPAEILSGKPHPHWLEMCAETQDESLHDLSALNLDLALCFVESIRVEVLRGAPPRRRRPALKRAAAVYACCIPAPVSPAQITRVSRAPAPQRSGCLP